MFLMHWSALSEGSQKEQARTFPMAVLQAGGEGGADPGRGTGTPWGALPAIKNQRSRQRWEPTPSSACGLVQGRRTRAHMVCAILGAGTSGAERFYEKALAIPSDVPKQTSGVWAVLFSSE
ncbi:hypothetical protein NDU88_004296 [Pleurodeles waltl]|uniref:Uncharacterized protein n=1 Tax=Pleurodeles waltl TaxID=8319 RepID=A0AAV7V1E6_PLEWA|nr:hypothetical protein NDU88_004296 [Pleurodeles waltl]